MKHHQKEKEQPLDLEKQNQIHPQKNSVESEKGRVEIEFYTDPLCCWSWALEGPWRQLLEKHGEQISYRYVMCGMIPDWNSYHDGMNSVSRPLQMGPVWMHASEITHVKMRSDIWHLDPPTSSYPACIAVKTAAQQSNQIADNYLLTLRKALMEEASNISKQEILFTLAQTTPGLDFDVFQRDWNAGVGKKSFREDLQLAKFHSIGRFPTLTFMNQQKQGFMIVGYRPFENLLQAFEDAVSGSY